MSDVAGAEVGGGVSLEGGGVVVVGGVVVGGVVVGGVVVGGVVVGGVVVGGVVVGGVVVGGVVVPVPVGSSFPGGIMARFCTGTLEASAAFAEASTSRHDNNRE